MLFSRIMADAILTKLMGIPAIDWAGGYKLENMSERVINILRRLELPANMIFSKLLEFVGRKVFDQVE